MKHLNSKKLWKQLIWGAAQQFPVRRLAKILYIKWIIQNIPSKNNGIAIELRSSKTTEQVC
jgi:hypothetical protein